jgi:hypothetical protein
MNTAPAPHGFRGRVVFGVQMGTNRRSVMIGVPSRH